MTKADFPLLHRTLADRPSSRLPWILGLLGISGLLHLFFINWFTGASVITPPASTSNPVITATLEAPRKPIPVEPVDVEKPKPKPKPKPRIQTPVAPAPVSATAPAPTVADAAATSAESDPIAAVGDSAGNDAVDAPSEPVEPPQAAAAGVPAVASYQIDLPPSVTLKYDVQKIVREGQTMYGHGSISWQTDGVHYTVDGDAGVLFFTVLNFRSEGTIDGNGIAPEIYSEKRFRKAETATHFHRERNTISFSSSTKSYPRTGGEQDRASVIWQLAGIGRSDAGKFSAGAQIDLVVAGTRDADIWSIVIVGEEDIDIAGEHIQAWHVTRIPRAGSRDQKLDIWFASQQNWYPVRLRFTEANGDFLDMSLTSLSRLPTPLSNP